jgi:hypothetical protein
MTTKRYETSTHDPRLSDVGFEQQKTSLDTSRVADDETFDAVSLSAEMAKLTAEVDDLRTAIDSQPNSWSLSMMDLGDPDYRLIQHLPVLIQEYDHGDEVIAKCPELELFGEGNTPAQALRSLKGAILDLYDELVECAVDTLGEAPKSWLRILRQVIVREP